MSPKLSTNANQCTVFKINVPVMKIFIGHGMVEVIVTSFLVTGSRMCGKLKIWKAEIRNMKNCTCTRKRNGLLNIQYLICAKTLDGLNFVTKQG